MICKHCGRKIRKEDIIVCPNCGRKGCDTNDGGCMPAGVGCICPECDEQLDEELDVREDCWIDEDEEWWDEDEEDP